MISKLPIFFNELNVYKLYETKSTAKMDGMFINYKTASFKV